MKISAYILIGLVVFVMIAFFIMGKKSQKGAAIGLVDGKLAACSSKPNCVSSEEGADVKHKIVPLRGVSFQDATRALEHLLEQSNGKITKSQNGYLAAEFTSGIFKFVDDLEMRQDGNNVHIRSASRIGHSDAGVNRKRVETLRTLLVENKEAE